MTAEEWRPVVGIPGYFVSSLGRIVSHKRKQPRELRPVPNVVSGYLQVCLIADDGRQTNRKLHRLVAEAFLGTPEAPLEVRHLDGDHQNNRANNLAWGTHAENMQDRLRHGNHPMKNKTQCIRGHAYTLENTYTFGDGWRACRQCRRAAQAAYAQRRAFRAANVPLAS